MSNGALANIIRSAGIVLDAGSGLRDSGSAITINSLAKLLKHK
jgi:hypothetical protein